MDTEKGWNLLHDIVAACCEQSSWVTLDEAGHVVGFLLVKQYANTQGMMREGDGRYGERPECEFFWTPF